MTHITDEELSELERLEKAATPANWFTVPYGDGDTIVIHSDEESRVFFPPLPVGYSASPGSYGDPAVIKADMALIAAMRNALPRLLAEVRRARAEALEEAETGEGNLLGGILGRQGGTVAYDGDGRWHITGTYDLRAAIRALKEKPDVT